jgi:hypothetical protein
MDILVSAQPFIRRRRRRRMPPVRRLRLSRHDEARRIQGIGA